MKRKVSKIFAFIMTSCMVTGLFANASLKAMAEDNSNNLISNGTFEDGTTNGWTPRGAAVLTATKEDKASGNYSMKVTGRQDSWQGPSVDLKGKLQKSKTYNISMKIKVVKDQATAGASDTNQQITLSMDRKETGAANDSYDTIAWQKNVNEEAWTTITGTYSPSFDAYDTLSMYIESPNKTLQFYIDDVIVLDSNPVKMGENVIPNGDFEAGNIDGWSAGGSAKIEITTEDKASGNYSMKVSERKNSWDGPSYHLIDRVKIGSIYKFSLKVKALPGQSGAKEITIHTSKTVNGSDTWPSLKTDVPISDTAWTTVEAELSLADATSALSRLDLSIGSSNTALSFYIDDVSLTEEVDNKPLPIQKDIPSLKDVLAPYFPLGGAVQPDNLAEGCLSEQLVSKHYGVLVAGNQMKPSSLQPTEGNFTFGDADKIVDYAIAHNMQMRGHTLLWHSQVPDWFFQDPAVPSKPASKELLLQRLKTHITTVLKHFKDKYGDKNPIKWWDVVNEVIGDDANYRQSKWYQIAGPDYIETAFRTAHEVDPSMKLYINDYGIENNNAKTEKIYEVVKDLKAKGVPIDGIGMQMHIDTSTSVDAIKASIEKLASLGVDIQVTEMDLCIKDNNPITEEGYEKQARLYKQVFDLFKSEKDKISLVMLWGVTDIDSWLSDSQPLLFDSKFQAKPAYWAIVDPSKSIVNRLSVDAVEGTPSKASDSIWNSAKSITNFTYVKGVSGATPKIQTLWDNKNLYVKIDVSDNTIGNNDSVEIFLDKNHGKTTSYEGDDQHITIKRSDCVSDANVYTAYKVIPIDDISPSVGKVMGFDVRVNDDKGKGTIDSMSVLNDYGNRQDTNTAYFADLSLSGSSRMTKALYGTPTIDGIKDDIWNSANEISTDTWVIGKSGATAKVRTLWDEHNLYVLAEVTDSLLNKASTNAYEQDSVEVFIDENDGKTTSYQSDDKQIRVNFDNEQSFGGSKPAGFKSATSKTSTGYIVEEAIPLTSIKPADGSMLGFDVQVNDADASGTRKSVSIWNDASGNSYKDTSGFGNLLLVDNRTTPVVTKPETNPQQTDTGNGGSTVKQVSATTTNTNAALSNQLPKTGSMIDFDVLVFAGILLTGLGLVLVFKKNSAK
ncbi:endo-1,4-beta-xylanase [Clostridium sp. 19966]|uniref:endo-1,4-beta-xylanase n=1 Tax=Clostridium sp. 19966 TaxID=2768166 RepID=UPI0028DDD600|nr:endo-1,4-beta-xylanase [Clostridium sp. 19966]MDT8717219.1 endo-1,4-beta-xylanase [Clostridium sp. 19966]